MPGSYIGWGKTTQLGSGLGFALGAKLARPDATVVNLMGEAAFGMVGIDFETAIRCNLPILTIVMRNNVHGRLCRQHADRHREIWREPDVRAAMRRSPKLSAAMANA